MYYCTVTRLVTGTLCNHDVTNVCVGRKVTSPVSVDGRWRPVLRAARHPSYSPATCFPSFCFDRKETVEEWLAALENYLETSLEGIDTARTAWGQCVLREHDHLSFCKMLNLYTAIFKDGMMLTKTISTINSSWWAQQQLGGNQSNDISDEISGFIWTYPDWLFICL